MITMASSFEKIGSRSTPSLGNHLNPFLSTITQMKTDYGRRFRTPERSELPPSCHLSQYGRPSSFFSCTRW
jgi:hypothetical protein